MQNHLSKPEDLMLQNETPLRKSAPGPSNSSDEHVSCTAPATENASLQILFKCPTPAIVFLEMPQNPHVLLTFDQVHNPLRLPRETTSERPKVVRTPGVFKILTWTCALRRNGMHFFDVATSKSGPELVYWMAAYGLGRAPYPGVGGYSGEYVLFVRLGGTRSLFARLKLKMREEKKAGVFCAFWLRHLLQATTACAFSTSQLPKVVRTWCVLCIFNCKCASRRNGVQFFISHLARWLRARRFSEPTFRPSGATNHWKNRVFRDFPTFSRACIFFLLTLSLLWSSLLLFSSLWLFPSLLFICPYCRKFDF